MQRAASRPGCGPSTQHVTVWLSLRLSLCRLRGGGGCASRAGFGRAQIGADRARQLADAAADGVHDNQTQADDGCGQHDPVNGHSAGFVGTESFEHIAEFHGGVSFKVLLSVSNRSGFAWLRPLFRILPFGMVLYGPQNVAGVGSDLGIFGRFDYFAEILVRY